MMRIFSALMRLVCHADRRACGAKRSGSWPATEAGHLRKHPTCAACGRADDPEVHHIIPFHLRPDLELDEKNLITLCGKRGCHFLFGHLLSWLSYNAHVVIDAALMLARIKQRP